MFNNNSCWCCDRVYIGEGLEMRILKIIRNISVCVLVVTVGGFLFALAVIEDMIVVFKNRKSARIIRKLGEKNENRL